MPVVNLVTFEECPAVYGSRASMLAERTSKIELNCLVLDSMCSAFLMLMPIVAAIPIKRLISLCIKGRFEVRLSTARTPIDSFSQMMGQQMNDLVPSFFANDRLRGEIDPLSSSKSLIRNGFCSRKDTTNTPLDSGRSSEMMSFQRTILTGFLHTQSQTLLRVWSYLDLPTESIRGHN